MSGKVRHEVVNRRSRRVLLSIRDERDMSDRDDAAQFLAMFDKRNDKKKKKKNYYQNFERGTFGAASKVRHINSKNWKG